MFWLAVRADGIACDGVAVGVGCGEAPPGDEDPDGEDGEDGEDGLAPAAPEPVDVAPGLGDAVDDAVAAEPAAELNSDLLAGTSCWKDRKIAPSWGWVHSTLAVSVGTTSERG